MESVDYKLPDNIDETVQDLAVGSAVFCNSLLGNKEIAGILIVCNTELIKKLGINEQTGLNYVPEFKNRRFSFKTLFHVFELELLFGNKQLVKIHIHPYPKAFKDFLRRSIKYKQISVHFYIKDGTKILSIHRDISDEDEMAWFARFLEFTKDLVNNTKFDDFFKNWQLKEIDEKQKKQVHYFIFDRKVKAVNFKFNRN